MTPAPTTLDCERLWGDIRPNLPVSTEFIQGAWLVGSFADPTKQLDSDGEPSDVDIFLQVDDEAPSISCVRSRYGTVTVHTQTTESFDERDLQFLTSRQPGVSIDSFEHAIPLGQ